MNIRSFARLIPCLIAVFLGSAGCTGSKTTSTPVAAPTGQLIAESVKEGPGNPDEAKAAIRWATDLFKRMPQDVGVRLVEQSEYRVVAEVDWYRYQAAFRDNVGDTSDWPRVPVRQVWEATPHGGTVRIVMQIYYIGDDPAVAQQLRDGYKGTDLEAKPKSP